MANTMNAEDEATLQSIMDRAYEQASSRILADQLFDLEGQYGRLHQKYTTLERASHSQAGLLERIEALAREAAGTDSSTRRYLLLLDIIAAAGNGAAALRKALDAPIVIRKES